MNTTDLITKKQKNLLRKYAEKYGKKYLTEYVQLKYPGVGWSEFNKEHAQYLITGRKAHERRRKKLERGTLNEK